MASCESASQRLLRQLGHSSLLRCQRQRSYAWPGRRWASSSYSHSSQAGRDNARGFHSQHRHRLGDFSGKRHDYRGRYSGFQAGNGQVVALLLPFTAIRLDDAGDQRQGEASAPRGKGKAAEIQDIAESTTEHDEPHNEHGLDEDGEQAGILRKSWRIIERYIIEPLGTTRRFLFLAILFLPVIFTAPVLLLELVEIGQGSAASKRKPRTEERRTTRLWYRFLVKQMERAGPTFIKVRASLLTSYNRAKVATLAPAGTMGWV